MKRDNLRSILVIHAIGAVWMVRMRVRMMMVIMSMVMAMIVRVSMIVGMAVAVVVWVSVIMVMMAMLGRAVFEALIVAHIVNTMLAIRSLNTLHMMMMTFLFHADFVFKSQNLCSIFAHLAIHIVGAFENLMNPIHKSLDDIILVVEIASLGELNVRVTGGNFVSEVVNATNQNASKQKIWKNDDAFIAKTGSMFEAWFYKREGYTGIAHFTPAKSHAFP